MTYRIFMTCTLVAVLAATDSMRAEGDGKAAEVLAAARKAIGDKKLDALKTLTVEAQVQRNVGAMQLTTDTEILLELPDRYLRADTSSGPMSAGFTLRLQRRQGDSSRRRQHGDGRRRHGDSHGRTGRTYAATW